MDEREDRMLSATPPPIDEKAALSRFRVRVAAEGVAPTGGWTDALLARIALVPGGWLRPAAAAVGVVVVATALAMTGIADTILTVFEPKQVVAIRLDPRQMEGVPDPTGYGTLTWITRPAWHDVAGADAAAAEAGFAPLIPSSLPAGIPAEARFAVMDQAEATFAFDEDKARAAAAKVNATLPPMPAAIAGTTLTMSGGPAILQQYGSAPDLPPERAAWDGDPQLVIVQARVPVVTSNGATVDELRDYMLIQPGIPADVAAQIRAIGDPVRTLMVPVGLDLSEAKPVTVRGTRGYLVGDETGLGSGVIWVQDGFAYAVLASLGESELISLVNGLH